MKLKRKIMLSNTVMVIAPMLLAFVLWFTFIKINEGNYMSAVNYTEGNRAMSDLQSVLYLYESELSAMEWDKLAAKNMTSPQIQKLSELSDMGYHLEVKKGNDILFSNLEEKDISDICQISEQKAKTVSILQVGKDIVIRDVFYVQKDQYSVIAVYNRERVDEGTSRSVFPIYTISPAALVILMVLILFAVIVTNFVLTSWLDQVFLEPLDTLQDSAKKIAKGELEFSMETERKDEFGDVYREFDSMREQLKEAKDMQSYYREKERELLIGISHDLRSPLTSIQGYTEGIRDGIADTEEKRQRYCVAILTRTSDLEKLTRGLTDLVRLDGHTYHFSFERVNLDAYLKGFLMEHQSYIDQNNVTVEYWNEAETLDADVDTREMNRVFMNLLENTVKYRKKDESHVQINVRREQGVHMVQIIFLDDGPGVPEEILHRIFEAFYRGDESRTKPEKGSGLGLSIVKYIVEEHGGSVNAFCDDGLGVRIEIPIANS